MGAPGGSYDAAKAERQGRTAPKAARTKIKWVEVHGGVEVRLGVVTVAVISPNPANRGRAEFIFRVLLPSCPVAPMPAPTLAAAKLTVVHRVADWFDAIGQAQAARSLREVR